MVSALTRLINDVYRVAEDGLWVTGAARTTVAEVTTLIRAGQVAIGEVDGRLAGDVVDGRLAGCVRIQELGDGVGEFGMLAVAPGRRGTGLGRELVRFAEQTCRDRDCHTMQLELLVPRDWTHPSKQFLDDWYTRIGYEPVRIARIEESYPDLTPLLACACDFVIYRKSLGLVL
ncbi:MAG TPA: GNAT family N-acetyltransferase [Streptosporangiaceae bacterium]